MIGELRKEKETSVLLHMVVTEDGTRKEHARRERSTNFNNNNNPP